ncbi:MAG: TolC family protein [Mariprofundaceae bacterium]|nr:TolC family protein [Mariprofundaceae bacterium]
MLYPKHICLIGMLLGTFPQITFAQNTLTLQQAVKQAVSDSPYLAAQVKHIDALREVAPQVSSLPDPRLSVNALNLPINSFSNTQENMTQWQVGIRQDIPSLGKLSLKSDIADQLADIAKYNTDEVRLKLIERVKHRWWNISYLDHALATVAKNQDLLRQLIRIAETKYKVGEGLQQDVLLAQLELSKLLDIEIQLTSSRKQEEARFNRLLHQPANQTIQLSQEVSETLPDMGLASDLFEQALQTRPILARETLRIATMENRVLLAEEDYKPDFMVGAVYGLRSGSNPANGQHRADLLSVRVSMTLPWLTQNKQDHQVEQRQAELAQAEFSYDDMKDMVLADVSKSLTAYVQAKKQSSLYKTGIIPQAMQTVSSMLAAYQVNKVDFLNLVRAQITLYNYETQYWKVLAEANQSQASLDAAIGRLESGI